MPYPTSCSCGAPRNASSVRCPGCDAGPTSTRMRLLRCACGVRRPGDEVACPACGEAGGDEVVVRVAGGSTGWPARVAEVSTRRSALHEGDAGSTDAGGCSLCGTPMLVAGTGLRTCEVCDVAVVTAC